MFKKVFVSKKWWISIDSLKGEYFLQLVGFVLVIMKDKKEIESDYVNRGFSFMTSAWGVFFFNFIPLKIRFFSTFGISHFRQLVSKFQSPFSYILKIFKSICVNLIQSLCYRTGLKTIEKFKNPNKLNLLYCLIWIQNDKKFDFWIENQENMIEW